MYLLKRKIKDLVEVSPFLISYLELFYLQISPRILFPMDFNTVNDFFSGWICRSLDILVRVTYKVNLLDELDGRFPHGFYSN